MISNISSRLMALHLSPFILEPDLTQCMEMLAKQYEEYLGYLEIGFDGAQAREKAELQDSLKFKTAYHAWKACHSGDKLFVS
ncbi:hypothetical protein BXY57_0455 [Thermoflavifilum aggregans]|uniref:Uncharacterized protein n=1 Tax=Thermoflavifilum aggregans TaxID=454188 RepID=A0A2M9CSH4_9BACT|nr:hypothetical protein [Thermoflavifilum aggregans]PJJ74890.1 hypothetical protein BXY57_0455 [Thermoflavifilum aggregans]